MDLVVLVAAAALWAATFGLAIGCDRLLDPAVTP